MHVCGLSPPPPRPPLSPLRCRRANPHSFFVFVLVLYGRLECFCTLFALSFHSILFCRPVWITRSWTRPPRQPPVQLCVVLHISTILSGIFHAGGRRVRRCPSRPTRGSSRLHVPRAVGARPSLRARVRAGSPRSGGGPDCQRSLPPIPALPPRSLQTIAQRPTTRHRGGARKTSKTEALGRKCLQVGAFETFASETHSVAQRGVTDAQITNEVTAARAVQRRQRNGVLTVTETPRHPFPIPI